MHTAIEREREKYQCKLYSQEKWLLYCRDPFICIVVESAQKSTEATLRSQIVGDF